MKTKTENEQSNTEFNIETTDHKLNLKSIVKALALALKNIMLFPTRALLFFVEEIGNLFKFSLAYKISFTYILISIFVFSIFILVGANNFFRSWLNEETRELLIVAEKTADNYRKHGIPERQEIIEKNNIFHIKQQVTLDNFTKEKQIVPELEYQLNSGEHIYIKNYNQHYLIACSSFKYQDKIYQLELVADISAKVKFLNQQLILIILFFLLILVLIIFLTYIMNKRLLSPIAKMSTEIKEISVNQLESRLNVTQTQDELKELAIQFNHLLDKMEDAYKRNNQFVSDASHELRTPISVIDGYVNMLARWGKNDEDILEEAIIEIKEETAHMRGLMEKLLFIAHTEQAKLDVKLENVSLTSLVNEVCRETTMIDSKHQINCVVTEELSVKANADYIKQMLRIFIENSRKFTAENGKIEIGAKKIDDKIMLWVKDSGCGIDRNDLPHVFDRFYKSDKARTKRKSGNGLGLSIAKWIIDQHNATAEITSTVGKGTTISVYFCELNSDD